MTKLLDSRTVAETLGVPTKTLDQWAYLGSGPCFVKVGKYRRYPADQFEAWVASLPTGGATK
jgi:DNA-binding transcriptional MerR regulator